MLETRANTRPIHEYAVSIVFSVILYCALFVMINYLPNNHRVDLHYGGAVSLELIGNSFGEGGVPRAQPPTTTEALFEDIQRQASSNLPSLSVKPPAKPQTLSELFGESVGEARGKPAMASSAVVDGLARQAAGRLGDLYAQASVARPVVYGKNGKALSCWRQLDRLVPVKIIVVLDGKGVMVGRPIIYRAPGAPVNAAIESVAMKAMAGCAPYAPATIAGIYDVMELNFGLSRDWVRQIGTTDIR